MKTLILTLLISIGSFAQPYFSVGVDFKNAIVGSDPTNNKPAFDGIFRFGMIGSVPGHETKIECSVGYESFKRIRFDRYIVAVGVNLFPFKKVVIIPSWEGSIIGRWGQEWQTVSSHIALLGANVGIRYKINYHWSVELNTGVIDRVDLNTRYGGRNIRISEQFKILYRL
jgi:hypothetical protein